MCAYSFGCATSAATVSRLIMSLRKESVLRRRAMEGGGGLPLDHDDDLPPVSLTDGTNRRETTSLYKVVSHSDKDVTSDTNQSFEHSHPSH